MSLFDSIPVYVTRPHGANEKTGSLWISAWVPLLALTVAFGNAIGWGIYGLVVLGEKVLG